jgi:hypothetical protein
MLTKIKTAISYFIALLSPGNYVDIVNSVVNDDELDAELRRRTGFDE